MDKQPILLFAYRRGSIFQKVSQFNNNKLDSPMQGIEVSEAIDMRQGVPYNSFAIRKGVMSRLYTHIIIIPFN